MKFMLQEESLRSLVNALVSANPNDEGTAVFLLEVLVNVSIYNGNRIKCIWPVVKEYLEGLLTTAARENQPYLVERVTVSLLRLAIRLRGEEIPSEVLSSLAPLTFLVSVSAAPLSRQISYGLFELLKIGAANIHSTEDWKVVFNLLECTGAGALQPKTACNAVLDETNNARKSPVKFLNQLNQLKSIKR